MHSLTPYKAIILTITLRPQSNLFGGPCDSAVQLSSHVGVPHARGKYVTGGEKMHTENAVIDRS